MYVVAITHLASPVETEAAALAAQVGTTAYEERLNLLAGLPAIVLTTPDRDRAQSLLAAIRGRGHGAIACDTRAVLSCDGMVSMRRFAFEADGLVAADAPDDRLPYADMHALVRAVHRTRVETRSDVKSTKLSVGRALVTGGLMVTKTVSREEKTIAHDRDQVLYVFRASGKTPWLLRERGTQYTALGRDLAPSSAQNFMTTIARLRERAPHAIYDERLTTPRNVSGRAGRTVLTRPDGASSVSTGSGVDLLAHLLALAVARGVYR